MIQYIIKSIFGEIQSRVTPVNPTTHHPLPYFSQFEPNWKRSGAVSKKENDYWSHNTCGMACLKMILKYKQNKALPIVTLAKKCTEYGGYILTTDEALGLFYEPFCRFVKKEFNLNASVAPFLTMKRIMFEMSQGNFVIASVSPEIRDRKNIPEKVTGGHLVLITGYDMGKKTISIHNPSGIPNKSQKDYVMTFNEFKTFFAGRGILVE